MTGKSGATRLVTAAQVAERFSVDIETVYRHTRRGHYKAFVINLGTERRPVWRYDEARLERWIDTRRAA